MSSTKHNPDDPGTAARAEAEADSGTEPGADGVNRPVTNNVTGRVKFDDRGNAVWEWAVATGTFGTDATHKRLKRLENRTLAIEDAPPPAESAAAPAVKENRKGMVQGYSPYDSGLLVKAAEQRKPKKDLRRLSEWLKLREQANRNRQDDE